MNWYIVHLHKGGRKIRQTGKFSQIDNFLLGKGFDLKPSQIRKGGEYTGSPLFDKVTIEVKKHKEFFSN